MKLVWLGAPAILLVITACGTTTYSERHQLLAVPTQNVAIPDLTKSEVIGLVRQYLEHKTYLSHTTWGSEKNCRRLALAELDAAYNNNDRSWSVWEKVKLSNWTVYERTGAIVANQSRC